jgi:oligopeptide transport system substrate-binding protein
MRKPLLRILAVLLAFTFIAAACGSDDEGGGAPEGDGNDVSGIPDEFPEKEEPTKGGVLTMAISADSNIDCYNGLSYYGISWSLFYFMARGLYGYPNTVESPETDEVQADLAEDMPEVSDDGLTYTVKLREGLTFPDGSPVTSADVKATYEYMMDPNVQCSSGGPPSSGYYAVIEGATEYNEAKGADPAADVEITGITTPDELTTEFTLTQPDGAFLRALAMGWSFIRPADTPHEVLETPPPFVGPYSISEFEADNKVVVSREPTWADNVAAGVPEESDENNIDGIELSIGVTDESQLGQIKNNELDLSYDGGAPTGADIPAVGNDPAYEGRFFSTADASVDYGFFRADTEPFNNVELRQAANWAIDRENIVRILGGELSRSPWAEILPANLMEGSEGEDGAVYTFDPDKAEELVEASGVETPIDVKLVHYADPPAPAMAAAIKENLDAVGFNVTLEPQSADVIQGFLSEEQSDYDLAFIAWGQDYSDAITFFGPLLSCPGGEPTGQNYGRFCDEGFQGSLEEISQMPTGAERTEAMANLSTETQRDLAPWFSLTNRRKVSFVSDRVGNYIWGPGKQLYFGSYFLKDA